MLKAIGVRVIKLGAFYLGGFAALGAVVVFGYQIIRWLKNDAWTHIPIIANSSAIQLEWLGVQRIVRWCADLPLALLCLVVAVACMAIYAWAELEEWKARGDQQVIE